MDCNVIISPRAIQDLQEIVTFVSSDNAAAAERLGYALIDAALSLATFPERGRLVPEFADGKTREISTLNIGSMLPAKPSPFPASGMVPDC